MPRNRIAVLRTVAYLFALVDVFALSTLAARRSHLGGALYRPLLVGRLLPLPVPTAGLAVGVRWGLVVAVVVALSGRAPRVAGAAVAALYFEWTVVAMSYGKVDHDKFAFLLLLCLLPTLGRVSLHDARPDEAAGWVVRMVQVGVVATYFLAAVAKLRYGGLAWVDSATLLRAVLRRGTGLGHHLVGHPGLLHAFQYVMLVAELASPLLLVKRFSRPGATAAYLFHAVTYACITIAFFPHLVALLSFFAVDRWVPAWDRARDRYRPRLGLRVGRPPTLR